MGCGAIAGHPVEMRFSVVFMFCVSFVEGAEMLSSPGPQESRPAPNETHPRVLAPSGSGASATE